MPSHIVELDNGTEWSIFPGDLDVTLNWQPDADLKLVQIDDDLSSHALISTSDNSRVRVIPASETGLQRHQVSIEEGIVVSA